MRKFNIKSLILGGIIGASLMFSVQSFAAVGDTVQAIFSDFSFIVNGKSVTPSETPIVINGNSYLPVRSIANLLNYNVTYLTDSRTIEFNSASVTGSTYGTANTPPLPSTTTPTPPNIPSTKELNTAVINGVTYFDLTDYVVTHSGESNKWVFDGQNRRYIYTPTNTTIDLSISENYVVQNGSSYINIKYFPKN